MRWIMTVDVKIRLPQVGAKMSLLGDDRKKTDENIHAQKRTLMNRPSPIGLEKRLFHIHGRSVYEMGRRPRLWESQAEMRRL